MRLSRIKDPLVIMSKVVSEFFGHSTGLCYFVNILKNRLVLLNFITNVVSFYQYPYVLSRQQKWKRIRFG